MKKTTFFVLIFFFIIAYFGGLFYRDLFTADETRYAEIAREMIQNNDWVVPQFNGLRYFEKPVMGHWLNALSFKVFGENNFAIRFSSALSALLCGAIVFILAKKFRDTDSARLSFLVYLSSALVYFVGTYAVLDSPTTLFITGAIASFYFAVKEENANIQALELAIFGIFCGAAFLTKGFIAFAVPAVVIIPFMIWEKRFWELFYLGWIPLVFILIVCLPWSIAIHLRDGDFWRYFVIEEHIQRFLGNQDSQHPQWFGFFIPVLLAGAMPWTLFSPFAFLGLKKSGRQFFKDPFSRYCLCWIVFPFLFFSASSGKLATYILPCLPPLAILFSQGIMAFFADRSDNKALRIIFNTLAVIFVAGALALATIQVITMLSWCKTLLFAPNESFKCFAATGALLLAALFFVLANHKKDISEKLIAFALALSVCFFCFHFIVPRRIADDKAPKRFLLQNAKYVNNDTMLVSYKNLVSAVCWYYKRDDVYLYHKAGELTYGIEKPDSQHRLLSIEQFEEMAGHPENDIVIIMDSKHRSKKLPKADVAKFEKNKSFKLYHGHKK